MHGITLSSNVDGIFSCFFWYLIIICCLLVDLSTIWFIREFEIWQERLILYLHHNVKGHRDNGHRTKIFIVWSALGIQKNQVQTLAKPNHTICRRWIKHDFFLYLCCCCCSQLYAHIRSRKWFYYSLSANWLSVIRKWGVRDTQTRIVREYLCVASAYVRCVCDLSYNSTSIIAVNDSN